jgi:osmotically-inducible protein OsmY
MRSAWLALFGAIGLGGCVAAVVRHGGEQGTGPGAAESAPAAKAADARLAADVRARLSAEKGLAAAAIEVRASEGLVRLRGHVAGAAGRALAERVARSVPGVKVVVSELEES